MSFIIHDAFSSLYLLPSNPLVQCMQPKSTLILTIFSLNFINQFFPDRNLNNKKRQSPGFQPFPNITAISRRTR